MWTNLHEKDHILRGDESEWLYRIMLRVTNVPIKESHVKNQKPITPKIAPHMLPGWISGNYLTSKQII